MATLVSFHAHPDDEAIGAGGTLAKASRDGHRTVLVFGTRGEHGEVDDGYLDDGESLSERRVKETAAAAEILGVSRVEYLGYVDSGMIGTPENEAAESFWQADIDEAAGRLADILRDEGCDVLTIYDDHGNYGHPDHIQVHRVGVRAAELAATPHVLEMTMNRDHIRRLMEARAEFAEMEAEREADGGEPPELDEEFGTPEELVTTTVDVSEFIAVKRAAMAAHASQINETSFFMQMPEEVFAVAFGLEFFIRRGVPSDHRDDDVFAGVDA